MTEEQKNRIRELRGKKCGYSAIAKTLGVTVSSVKSYCQRNNLAGIRAACSVATPVKAEFCKECGKAIQQKPGRKEIKFCSAACRQKWWNAHPEQVRHKAIYSFVCACCGVSFVAYGNSHRKYCSHSCYIRDRFGGGENE